MDINREILQFLHYHPLSSRVEISNGISFLGSDATMKRLLAYEVQQGNIVVSDWSCHALFSQQPSAIVYAHQFGYLFCTGCR